MQSKVRLFYITKDGLFGTKTIAPDYFSIVELLFGVGGDGYIDERDVYVNESKYHCYYDSLGVNIREYSIVAVGTDNKDCLIGNIVLTKLNKNGELYSLTDRDVANIKSALVFSPKKEQYVMGEFHPFSKIILKMD